VNGTPPMGVRTAARRGDTGPVRAPRKRRRRGPIALLLILILAAALAGAGWYYGLGPGSDIPTPSLLKLTEAQAKAKAAQVDLSVKVVSHAFSEVDPVGTVVDTDPAPGDDISKNGQIGLTLSKGPERYDVPTLTNKTEEEAGQILEDNHLVVGEPTRVYDDTVKEGLVITTDPPPGTPQRGRRNGRNAARQNFQR